MTGQNRQCLDFNLIRSGQLNRNEIAVLAYINTFSEFCAPPSLLVMAKAMQTSERTLRRTIDALCLKGLIVKTYRCFKRLRLQLVSLENQRKLLGSGMMFRVVRNVLKSRRKSSDRPNLTDLIRPPMTEPMQNKDSENKTSSEICNFVPVGDIFSKFLASRGPKPSYAQ